MSRRSIQLLRPLALAGVSLGPWAMPANAGDGETLRGFASYRAVYELSLEPGDGRGVIADVDGRIVYEFGGSVCDGFDSRFRMVARLRDADGGMRTSDLTTTAHESGDGLAFDFVNRNTVADRVVEDSRGSARRIDDRLEVRLTRPRTATVTLPSSALFPTPHLARIIDAAKAGRSFEAIDLFDGSEAGETTFRTTVVIGREAPPADAGPAAENPLLKGHRRWPITISYFGTAERTAGADAPLYQMIATVADNGVAERLVTDYGTFRLSGRLSSLEALPAAACP